MNLTDLNNLIMLFIEVTKTEPITAFINEYEYDTLFEEFTPPSTVNFDIGESRIVELKIVKITGNATYLRNNTWWMNMSNNKTGLIYKD